MNMVMMQSATNQNARFVLARNRLIDPLRQRNGSEERKRLNAWPEQKKIGTSLVSVVSSHGTPTERLKRSGHRFAVLLMGHG